MDTAPTTRATGATGARTGVFVLGNEDRPARDAAI